MEQQIDLEERLDILSDSFEEIHFTLAGYLDPDASIHNEIEDLVEATIDRDVYHLFRWVADNIEYCEERVTYWGKITSLTDALVEVQRYYYHEKLMSQLNEMLLFAILTHKKETNQTLTKEQLVQIEGQLDEMLHYDNIEW